MKSWSIGFLKLYFTLFASGNYLASESLDAGIYQGFSTGHIKIPISLL